MSEVYRATVTRATTEGIWIHVPARWGTKVEFGPLQHVFAGTVTEGERVLVVDTGTTDFVILGTLKTGVT